MNSGIKILPYIEKKSNVVSTSGSSKVTSSGQTTENTSSSFGDSLAAAEKAVAALTIDKMISESSKGSIQANQVQNYFNTRGININLANLGGNVANSTAASQTKSADSSSSSSSAYSGKTESADQTGYDRTDYSSNPGVSSSSTNGISNYVEGAEARHTIANTGTLKCSDELQSYFEEASEKFNVDIKLIKSVAFQESCFRNITETGSGAVGIMMLMPFTAEEYNVEDPTDPYQNIMGGTELLAKLINKYDGNLKLALAAYNAGPGAVKKYSGIPPYEETQNYVKKVLGYYNEA